MEIIFSAFTIKDWFILASLFILLLCILEIHRLKKVIAGDVQKQLIPQLNCELILDETVENMGLYLKNESFFLARSIKVEDIELTLDDLGYKVGLILRFEDIDSLGPQEKIKLKLKVFDRDQRFRLDLTERIIPHLISAFFKIKIFYSNIEGLKFCALFFKKKNKFYPEKIKTYV